MSAWRFVQLPASWFPTDYRNPFVWPDRWCLLPKAKGDPRV